jgi:exonuclease SbcC
VIPLQLTLKNFLSYQSATLDFRGLHVACICGANGAGKSSLLEAIVWAVWGESRASNEDDVIHLGATEALVDFLFQCHQQTYRIIRSRQRGQAGTLEFQVQTPKGLRSLTERGMRATQQLILQHLKLDYETFINSAYLRQGRADEFMLKRPNERKQILADLLKLDQYDALAEQSKEQTRQLKAELTVLERTLEQITAQQQQQTALATRQAEARDLLQQMQQQQQSTTDKLRQLQTAQQQQQSDWQQFTLQQQQQNHLNQDCQRLRQELLATQAQQQQLEVILSEANSITAHFTQLQQWQAVEEIESAKFQTYQALQSQKQQLQQQYTEQVHWLKAEWRQVQTQLDWQRQQQQEIEQVLVKAAEIEAGVFQLQQARVRLAELDQLQMQVAPLIQRRHQLQTQLDRQQARLTARLEELHTLRQQLEVQQQNQDKLRQAATSITNQIEYLEQRRLYQQQVREKGIERRTFMERLQEQQRKCEREMAALDHKLLLLKQGEEEREIERWREGESGPLHQVESLIEPRAIVPRVAEQRTTQLIHFSTRSVQPSYPPCPLCHRPLDEQHWQIVLQHHQQEKQEIQDQLWVIREQLTTSDREIRVLRQEYRDLEKELAQYGTVLEQRGKLQEQLQTALQGQQRLQQVIAEQIELERLLHHGDYAADLHEELNLLHQSLQQLNYDDRDHALARGQVDRWRWAEVKAAEIRQAQRKQAQFLEQQPQLEATAAALQHQLESLQTSALWQAIGSTEQQLQELDYDPEHHAAIRQAIRQAQPWQLRYQALGQAQQHYPQLQQRQRELAELWTQRHQALEAISAQVQRLEQQIQQTPDLETAIQEVEQQMQQRREQLDICLAELGRLQEQEQQLAQLNAERSSLSAQLQTQARQLRVYQELAQAFGKNGIQALMIENVLPQLEAETNHILGRLSANQLHVQFVTQRASRKASASNKLIDTLDILISDAQGTRPYETYSGGEAFRVNFAIRLALARLLAQRSGMALQLLIIDEGFGTQDEAGCDRLIGAINAIASDFACILTVTHMPHLKEAFQTRIEVCKTERGSQLHLSA